VKTVDEQSVIARRERLVNNRHLRSQTRLASNQPFREGAVPKLPIVSPVGGCQSSEVQSVDVDPAKARPWLSSYLGPL
jgi:hypothetical protein